MAETSNFTIDSALDALTIVAALHTAAESYEKQAHENESNMTIRAHYDGLAKHARSLARAVGTPWRYTT